MEVYFSMLETKRGIPIQDTPSRGSGVGIVRAAVTLALLRILASYSWLNGAFIGKDAKFSPDFLAGPGLVSRITGGPNGGFAHTAINRKLS